MNNIPNKIDGIEFLVNGRIKVSSVEISKRFEKEHYNVIRDIESLDVPESFTALNYEVSEYKDKSGKMNKCYNMTRDGYMFLVMGFKGSKAAIIKVAFLDAFNKMEAYIIEEESRKKERALATMHAPEMTDAIKELKEGEGKTPKPYHFSNEFDMINRIVLGVTAKKWRDHMELEKKDDFRDALSPAQIEAVQNLQTANTVLIEMGMEYQERKKALDKIYNKKFAKKCLDEVLRDNA